MKKCLPTRDPNKNEIFLYPCFLSSEIYTSVYDPTINPLGVT